MTDDISNESRPRVLHSMKYHGLLPHLCNLEIFNALKSSHNIQGTYRVIDTPRPLMPRSPGGDLAPRADPTQGPRNISTYKSTSLLNVLISPESTLSLFILTTCSHVRRPGMPLDNVKNVVLVSHFLQGFAVPLLPHHDAVPALPPED